MPDWRALMTDADDAEAPPRPLSKREARKTKNDGAGQPKKHHAPAFVDLARDMVGHVVDHQPADVKAAYACALSPAAFAAQWRAGAVLVKPLRGINIQRPWAGLILDGLKKIEARTYDVRGYADEWLWLIETPGKDKGKHVPEHMRSHRITGIVRFSSRAVKYDGADDWRSHEHLHRKALEKSSNRNLLCSAAIIDRVLREQATRGCSQPPPTPVNPMNRAYTCASNVSPKNSIHNEDSIFPGPPCL